jgi:hypothetical protein
VRMDLSSSPAIVDALIRLGGFAPIVDGVVISQDPPHVHSSGNGVELSWPLSEGRFVVCLSPYEFDTDRKGMILRYRIDGWPQDWSLDSFGLSIGEVGNLRSYLRNGYTSWDGSFYVEPEALRGLGLIDDKMRQGYGMTQLLPRTGRGSVRPSRASRFSSSLMTKWRTRFASGQPRWHSMHGQARGYPRIASPVGAHGTTSMVRWMRPAFAIIWLPRLRRRRVGCRSAFSKLTTASRLKWAIGWR